MSLNLKVKMNNIFICTGIIIFISSIFAIPYFTSSCRNEDCFKSKYKTSISIAVITDVSTRGRSSTCEYEYIVNGKIYYTHASPTSDFEQIGDSFNLLYDIDNPENCLVLYHRPIVPLNLSYLEGKVTYFRNENSRNRIIIELSYDVNNYNVKRLEYFPIELSEKLKLIHDNKEIVKIGVVKDNVRRGYLILP